MAPASARALCCGHDFAAPAPAFVVHGPAAPRVPLVLDSPHSGFDFPADFGSVLSEFDLRDGEDCFVDELYLPATERGVGLIAALRAAHLHRPQPARRRHRPRAHRRRPLARRARAERQGPARQGARLAHARRRPGDLRAQARASTRCSAGSSASTGPYHGAVRERIEATHARFGAQLAHRLSFDERRRRRAGRRRRRRARADFVVGDRDGTTCDAGVHRARARASSPACGYDVRVNDPYKGVELVRAYSNPAERRMSLQLEINKRLYMDEATRTKNAGFATLQQHLLRAGRRGARLHDERARRARPMSASGARPAPACRSASSSSAAPAGRCRRTRSRSTGRRAGATRSRSPSAAASAIAVAQHGRWMRGEIAAPGGVEPPSREALRAALGGRDLACWCAAERAVPRRSAADDRQPR